MQDDALSHAAHLTIAHLAKKCFKDTKLMIWSPTPYTNINPIKNLQAITKKKLKEMTMRIENCIQTKIFEKKYKVPTLELKQKTLKRSMVERLMILERQAANIIA